MFFGKIKERGRVEKIDSSTIEIRDTKKLIEELKAQLARAVEVIEFYGDKKNWHGLDEQDYLSTIKDQDVYGTDTEYFYGGCRAMQFLAKIKEKV